MANASSEYSVDAEIRNFFAKTSTTRLECDTRAIQLVGGTAVPVDVQGVCSYSVYAGPDLKFVFQFRLKSLELNTETATLARKIYGSMVPEVSFKGQIGDDIDGKEPLYVYVMDRVRGISHLDFVLAHGYPENSSDNINWRKALLNDIARYDRSPSLLPGNFPAISYSTLMLSIVVSLRCHGKPLSRLIQLTVINLVKHMSKNCGYYFLAYRNAFITSFKAV